MPQPALGRVVHVLVHPTTNNGSDIAAATIVRVWEPHPDGGYVVNLRVHLDSSHSEWFTSVRLRDTEEQAREHGIRAGAFWPPHV